MSLNLQYVSKAILPKVMTTTTVLFNRFNSLLKYSEQLVISELVGLFIGGAHFTIEVTYASDRSNPSSIDTLLGLLAKPVSNIAFINHSPELSPVNILPVLLPPLAAGAKPIINNLALGSPKDGTGFAQYVWPLYLCGL
jgi:hypothetical protein